MKPAAAFFWRRLDHPRHESCRLFRLADGWRLAGAAVFLERHPCHFQYEVLTDAAWRTRRARVAGYLGNREIELQIRAARSGHWHLNGAPQEAVAGCVDLDLGFTPASNMIPLRRLALKVGERAEAPAAYLAFPAMRITRLPQTYRRVSRNEYGYESPTAGYSGRLRVDRSAAIVCYPGLFERMPARSAGAVL